MSDEANNTETLNDAQAEATVTRISPEKHEYDEKGVLDFLQLVFGDDLDEDEEILTWFSPTNVPAYPLTVDALKKKMGRIALPRSMYYATATATPDEKDGRVYNRKSLFKKFYVLVLDDIGTKVSKDKLPEGFEPTYIIESSAGNYQYGYVLEDPIEDIELAEALVQLVYNAGFSDGGGKMANKLVRLPEGVNGKKGAKGEFKVHLTKDDGKFWTPEEILEVLDLGLTWDEVKKDAKQALITKAYHKVGTTPWSPIHVEAPSVAGIVDPLLEWLYLKNLVVQETNEWITVKCPWESQHTSGERTAGYSPLGIGGKSNEQFRAFHCFHDSCQDKHISDFILECVADGAPEVSSVERAGHLTSTYVFDSVENAVWDVKGRGKPRMIPMQGFKNLHPQKVRVMNFEGKLKEVSEVGMYISSKARVDVVGQIYDPTTPAKLVAQSDGSLLVNSYTSPSWGDGDYDQADIGKFNAFMRYLIPDDDERYYFLNWLGAKTQNMAFRGAGILMVATAQGTGRTTLASMIATMFGAENVEKVPFDRLSGNGDFNEWQTIPIVITDETLAVAQGDNFYKVYERIKERIDTSPELIRVNPKYGKQRQQMCYSSMLMFSNHENAMAVGSGDRRIYVISNPHEPANQDFFTELNKWLDQGTWAKNVWRWLRQRKVDVPSMLSPAVITKAKHAMVESTKHPVDIAIDAIIEAWTSNVIAVRHVNALLTSFTHRIGVSDPTHLGRMVTNSIRRHSVTIAGGKRFKVDGSSVRLRLITTGLEGDPQVYMSDTKALMKTVQEDIHQLPDAEDLEDIKEAINDALTYMDL